MSKKIKADGFEVTSGQVDADAIHDNAAAEISVVTEKALPVAADVLLIEDSADSDNKKKVQIGNLPGGGAADALSTTGADVDVAAADPPSTGQVLKAADATHATWQAEAGGGAADALSTTGSDVDVAAADPPSTGQVLKASDPTHATWQADTATDVDAVHKNVAAEISTVTEKGVPVSADLLLLEDSADSNNKKRVQIGNLPGGGAADALSTTGADVDVAAAAPPATGQVLKATGSTTATWQTPVSGFGGAGETLVNTIRAGDVASNDSATPLVVSQFAFDPSEYGLTDCTRSLVFRAVAANGGGVAQTKARLYNVTDGEYVGAGVTFTSPNATKQEETLTIGSGAGEIDDSEKIYEVRIWVVSPDTIDDTIELGSAELRLVNTIASAGFGGTGEKLVDSLRAGDVASHDSATPMVVSQFTFDPSEYVLAGCTRSLVFRAVAANGGGVAQTKARIYSVTDAEYIGVGITFTTAAPAKQEETLTIGSGAGEVDDSEKIYEVRIWVVSPDLVDDTIALGSAELRLVNTLS